MGIAEQGISWLQSLSPLGVLAFVFLVAYIENLVPPSPSDVLLIFAGTLIGIGTVGFWPSLTVATAGSVTGFLSAYLIGRHFERSVMSGRMSRILPVSALHTAEALFRKYGYGVIVANRFLAGTRAIVSFFAGMSKMNLPVTTLLCGVSALAWNAILLSLGRAFAGNWREAASYVETYGKAATGVILLVGAVFAIRYWRSRRASGSAGEPVE